MNTNVNAFNPSANGVYLITVTPFKDGGELDLASTDRMVDFCLERCVTGLTILGIMGEATQLTAEQSRVLIRLVLALVPVKGPVVGVASPASPHRCAGSSDLEQIGCAGVMIWLATMTTKSTSPRKA